MFLALVLLLLVACWSALHVPAAQATAPGEAGDLELYGAIVDGVRHGGDYYTVAADALRTGDYPLRPFVTFRLPALAIVEGALPVWLVAVLLGGLVTAVLIAWYTRLAPALGRWQPRIVLLIVTAGGLTAYAQPELAPFHEIWAGLLVALSLAVWRDDRWLEAAMLGLCAMLIRETAALYVAVMAVLALNGGARREAAAWSGALAVLGIVVACHAHAVAGVVRPLDPASRGWTGLLGFGFFVRAMTQATALTTLPLVVAAPLVGLALIGWIGWKDALGTRVVTVLIGYAALLATFGRADNLYWGLLVAPLLLPGLVLAPDALRDLVTAALTTPRITVKRLSR